MKDEYRAIELLCNTLAIESPIAEVVAGSTLFGCDSNFAGATSDELRAQTAPSLSAEVVPNQLIIISEI